VEGQTDEDEYDLLLEADAEDTAVERVRSLRRICGLPFLNSAPAPEEPLDEPLTEEEKEFQIVNVLKPSAGCTLEDSKQGVVVKHVLRAGAAAHATLVSGDVILTVNNTPVPTKKTFLDVVKQSKPGDVIRIAVKRGFDNRGETLSLELFSDDIHYPQTTVRELRQRFNLSAAITLLYDAQTASEEVAELELSIGFALGDNMQVTELVHGSTAAVAGLENGDIITHVDHQAIGTVAQFGAVLVQYLPGDFSSLRIQGKTEEVLVELAAVGKGNSVEWVRSLRSMAAQDEGESTTTEG
jgi:S1-C subfamily serine protease